MNRLEVDHRLVRPEAVPVHQRSSVVRHVVGPALVFVDFLTHEQHGNTGRGQDQARRYTRSACCIPHSRIAATDCERRNARTTITVDFVMTFHVLDRPPGLRKTHIPSDLVVDQWVSNVESSSPRDFLLNWLRVLGTAEHSQVDQGVRQPLHPKVSWLDTLKPEEEPLECIFPRKGPIDTGPQGMTSGIEEPFPPTRWALAVAEMLCDVRDHAGVEHALAIVGGINARVEIQRGAFQVQPDLFGDCQGLQPLRQQDHVCLIHRCDWERRQHIAMVVGDGHDLLPLLVLIA